MGGPIKIGSVTIDTIGQLKVGSFNVQQAYVGSVLVFPATTTTTTTTSTTSTTSTTTSTTTAAPTTSTTTSTTTATPTTTTSTTSTTTLAPTTTTSTTSTTTIAPTTTTTTSTTTLAPTTSTTTSTTTEVPTTTTTSTTSTTTIAPTTTTSTTTSTTTEAPTTTTTTSTTTLAPTTTTSTTTSTTTEAPTTTTTTSTTTSTTTEAPTTTTTTSTSTTTTTTTCAPQNAQSMYYNYDTGLPTMFGTSSTDAACNLSVSASTVYYSASLALTNGTPLYHDECLTIPITASAYTNTSLQYFKIGPYYVNFETNGYVVRDIAVCPEITTTTSTTTTTTTAAPTVTINWDVREQGSGHVSLVIKDSSDTILLSQVSSNTGPINGTLNITEAQTPYSITVSVDAGTEVAQWRVCNDTDSVEIAHNYSVSTTETYTVNPTPLTTSVFATYGDSNTPIVCSVA